MNTVVNGLVWSGLVIGLAGTASYANQQYHRYQNDKFCREIDASDTAETVIVRAHSQNLPVREFYQVIRVGRHRYPCRIELNGQTIVKSGTG